MWAGLSPDGHAADKDRKDEMQNFLLRHTRVNTLFRINNGYDFFLEAIFRNMNELDEFTRQLDEYHPKEKE